MPKGNKKKRSALRNAATSAAAGSVRVTGRYPKAEIEAHVQRFRKLAFNSGGQLTQEQYAKDHGIAAGTFSRWMSEHKDVSPEPTGRIVDPARMLPAAPEDPKAAIAEAKRKEKENGKLEARLAELEERLARTQREKEELESGMATLELRNQELRQSVKLISGSL